MPITFKVAKHEANGFKRFGGAKHTWDAQRMVSEVWQEDGTNCKEMLQSSYRTGVDFIPDSNGFVNTVIHAYNKHHSLVLRPDDLWTSILSQLNIYVNAHAEELRSKFVAHKGKKELVVVTSGDRYSVDFGELAQQVGNLLKENIIDHSLHDWIIPDFTTTTSNDVIVCSVMMMSTLKAYFSYGIQLSCGIPSITLLGEKADYMLLLRKIEKLAEFGEEPTTFARLLQPILQEFCNVFDSETPNHDFWSRICHYEPGGSGPDYLGGWISAFSVWNGEGKWQGGNLEDIRKPLDASRSDSWGAPRLVWTGLRYPVIPTDEIPNGFCDVDVKLNDNGEIFDCKMVAGHIGYAVSTEKGQVNHLPTPIQQRSGPLSAKPADSLVRAFLGLKFGRDKEQAKHGKRTQEQDQKQAGTSDIEMLLNTLQPASHWFMFITEKTGSEAEIMEKMLAKTKSTK